LSDRETIIVLSAAERVKARQHQEAAFLRIDADVAFWEAQAARLAAARAIMDETSNA